MKKILLLIGFISWTLLSIAQQDLTLYDLRSVPQANQINVSRMPYSNGYLLLPGLSGIYTTVYNQGFNYNDMFTKKSDGIYLEMDRALERMGDLNDLGSDVRFTVLGFGFRTGASYFTFNVEEKISARVTYPKTLMEFFWYGNAHPDFLDKRVSMDNLGGDYMQYTETSFGWAKDFSENLTIGMRAKYLSGHANFKTVNSSLGFTTLSESYEIAVDGSAAYNSAGAFEALLDSTKDFEDMLGAQIYGNHGGAIDLGVTYRYSNRLSFSASVNDIGMIMWREGITNGVADTVDLIFEGEELWDYANGNIDENKFGDALDTLFSSIDFVENNKEYNTWLPTKIYLGANYKILQKTDLGILTYNEFYNNRFRTSIRVAMSQRVRNWLMATVNYSFYGRSLANVGLGFSANAGPVQLYFATDNVLSYIFPNDSKNFHLRFGINLTFSNNFSQN